jgi:hypothetical protein
LLILLDELGCIGMSIRDMLARLHRGDVPSGAVKQTDNRVGNRVIVVDGR